MKINNETKIGILAVVGIVLFILGFNYLKGKSLFKKEVHLYAVYDDINGLAKSNPVVINGLQVGNVSNLDGGREVTKILVTITLKKDVLIPDNSLAVITPNLLGTTSLEIKLGKSRNFLKDGDTLITTQSGGAFDEALKMLNPVLYEVKNAVKSLDSVLHLVTNVFDPTTKNNIKAIIQNLNSTTASFSESASSLKILLNPNDGALAKSLNNVKEFTGNLASNSGKINNIMTNADKATTKLANLDVQKTLNSLDSTVNSLKSAIAKIDSKNGSLGLLLNDTKLYDNLTTTGNKINILLDDIRVHPKRYLSVSVFGKKDKGNYITAPLKDDSTKIVSPAK
jgi:phospholipid/cholesterol/gamma-HCH transport system substrate-binding protein